MTSAYRYRTAGQDNWTAAPPPRSDADRRWMHGPLLPMEQPADQPPHWLGVVIALAGVGILIAAVLLIKALVS